MLSAQRSHGGIVDAAKAKAKAAVGDVLRRFCGMVISGTTPVWWLVQERDGRRAAVGLTLAGRGGRERQHRQTCHGVVRVAAAQAEGLMAGMPRCWHGVGCGEG